MFSELPKLLGRDFVLAFLMPATVFALGHHVVFGQWPPVEGLALGGSAEEGSPVATTGAVVATGLLALMLMLLNRVLIRLKEGHGLLEREWSPFLAYQRRRWHRLQEEKSKADEDIEASGGNPSRTAVARQIELHKRAATEFPDAETWLLPTAFGNVLRAFEVYPRVMYGFDAIPGWTRLLAVIPSDYRAQIDAAGAQVNLWVNAWALSLVFALECFVCHWVCGAGPHPSAPAVALLLAWLSSRRARFAAIEWGEFVKSAFDIYLPELAKKMGLEGEGEGVREGWRGLTQAALYRDPGALEPSENVDSNEEPKESLLTLLELMFRLLARFLRR